MKIIGDTYISKMDSKFKVEDNNLEAKFKVGDIIKVLRNNEYGLIMKIIKHKKLNCDYMYAVRWFNPIHMKKSIHISFSMYMVKSQDELELAENNYDS